MPIAVTGSPPVTPAETRDTAGDGRVPTLHEAPTAEVVDRLRRILVGEAASALTSYDCIGVYGHRDHVRVHQIAAAAVNDTDCDLVEATVSRPFLRRLRHDLLGRGLDPGSWPAALVDGIGTDDETELIAFDVSAQQAQKRAAIAAHASQVVEAPTFMGLPPGAFHRLLGIEWFHPTRRVDGRFTDFLRASGPDTARTHEGHNFRLAGPEGWSRPSNSLELLAILGVWKQLLSVTRRRWPSSGAAAPAPWWPPT